ncbi:MAG: hypothetical protein ACRYFR_07130 [Janthinobacterium lividum]
MKPLLLLSLALLLGCKKNEQAPVDQLPPATQTGANTFGCLLNGQTWTPKGNDGASNYTVYYDKTPAGDLLDLHTYRIYGQAKNEFQNIVLFINNINGLGSYSFRSPQHTRASLNDVKIQLLLEQPGQCHNLPPRYAYYHAPRLTSRHYFRHVCFYPLQARL